jgi:hypothetical protein
MKIVHDNGETFGPPGEAVVALTTTTMENYHLIRNVLNLNNYTALVTAHSRPNMTHLLAGLVRNAKNKYPNQLQDFLILMVEFYL